MAAKQRLDDQRLVPWIDEPSRSIASARGNIDRSPFATPAGQRSVSERVPNARLPPAQAVASSATWDRMRSWLTAQVQFFHRSAPPWRKTMTKKEILALSQPPRQHTCQPSICSPTSTGRGKRRNEGIWSQFPLVHIYASG